MRKKEYLFFIIGYSVLFLIIMLDITELIDVQKYYYWVWSAIFIIEHLCEYINTYFKNK